LKLVGALCFKIEGHGFDPDELTKFLNQHPCICIMIMGSTRTLTEMSTRNLLGSKGQLVRKVANLTIICELVGASKSHNPKGLQVCYMDSFHVLTMLSLPYSDILTFQRDLRLRLQVYGVRVLELKGTDFLLIKYSPVSAPSPDIT
jgi:hypothetical protein